MRVISDIEIHSRYSRACSRDLTPENIDRWAKIKGVNLIGTGDFTHPLWLGELKASLEEAEPGFYKLKSSSPASGTLSSLGGEGLPARRSLGAGGGVRRDFVRFILSAEVSCIYSQAQPHGQPQSSGAGQGGKVRRVHHILLAPSFAAVEKFNKILTSRGGKLGSDGRPILGMTSPDVLKYLLEADPDSMLIPAHVWTPYFGLFGSKSGFDSVEECFGEMTKHIHALETGLSSDPEMNWRVSSNDRFTLVSSSDAHSLPRIGREANVMEVDKNNYNYKEFTRIIREKDGSRFKFTIEYFPEEGKYHLDGHASCKISLDPEKTLKYKGECPSCGKKITVGVLSRVQTLADRPQFVKPEGAIPQKHLVPLEEVLAECTGLGAKTKTVQGLYWKLVNSAGSEFAVILDLPIGEIREIGGEVVAEAVKRVREEKVEKIPGYDGVYGIIKIFTEAEREELVGKTLGSQKSLF